MSPVSLAPKGKKTGNVRNIHSSCLGMHNKPTSAEIQTKKKCNIHVQRFQTNLPSTR